MSLRNGSSKHVSVIQIPPTINVGDDCDTGQDGQQMTSDISSGVPVQERKMPPSESVVRQPSTGDDGISTSEREQTISDSFDIEIDGKQQMHKDKTTNVVTPPGLTVFKQHNSPHLEVKTRMAGLGKKQKNKFYLPLPKNARKEELKKLKGLNRGDERYTSSKMFSHGGLKGLRALMGMSVSPSQIKDEEEEFESSLDLSKSTEQTFNIWQAVRDRRPELLKKLLKARPDSVNDLDNKELSALHLASKLNCVPAAEVLIQHNADVNIRGVYGMSPLHVAARHNSRDVAQLLLDNKALILCQDCKQKTPLHIAAKHGHQEFALMLLKIGTPAIANAEDEDSMTPLHEAVQRKQIKMVTILLQYGANVFVEDINDVIPFQFAAAEDAVDIMELILNAAFDKYEDEAAKIRMINHVDNEGNTALHLALYNNKFAAAEFLVEAGSSVNKRNCSCATPLHMAAINGSVPICCLLLNHGAKLERRDKEQMTAMHRAALHNRWQIIELLMKKGGDINAKSGSQMTPLMMASWKGNLETTEFLLTNGAQIAETDESSRTALHWAVDSRHISVVQQLLKHGCISLLDAQDQFDQTVLHYTAKDEDTTILNVLLKHGCKLDIRDQDGKTPLHVAAQCGNSRTVEALVTPSEINDGDADGKSPLIVACEVGNYQTARTLIHNGADLCVRDEDYRSALMLAASEGHCKVIHLLLNNFAEVDHSDKIKNTALHMAVYNGHADSVKLLLSKNASTTLRNSYGRTALDVAIEHKHSDCAVAILQHKTWRDVMEMRNVEGYTAMKRLIEKVPDAALVVLDNCVEYSNHRKDDLLYTIKFDYSYVDPGPDDVSCKDHRYYALRTMVEYGRGDLLGHPLMQSLLLMKWRKFGRVYFYLNLLLYLVYLILLLIYTSFMPRIKTSILDDVRSCPVIVNDTTAADPVRISELKAEGTYSKTKIDTDFVFTLEILLNVLVVFYMLKELFGLFTKGWRYFLDRYMYMTWAMLISTIYMLQPSLHLPCEHEWRSGWISALLAWTLFLLYLRGLNVIGLYFVMFTEVFVSLLKVSFVLILFLLAFSTAFSITAAQTDGFKPDDFYLLTTLAMTLGDMNFVDNFMGSTNDPFKIDNLVIMALFMFIMPIAVMNLLIGIAVGDIDKVQKQAYLTRLSLQIEQICQCETAFPRFIQRKLYQRKYELQPNVENMSCWNRLKRRIFGGNEDVEFISEEKGDVVTENLQQLKKDMKKQKMMMVQMQVLQKQQQEMMQQICQHLDVNVQLSAVSPVETIRSDMFSRMDY